MLHTSLLRPIALLRSVCVLVLLGSAACHSQNDPQPVDIEGSWKLVKTSGGLAGSPVTPVAAAQQQTLVLSANGQFRLERPSQQPETGTWARRQDSSIVRRQPSDCLVLSGAAQPVKLLVNQLAADELTLTHDVFDSMTYIYERQ